MKRLLVVLFVLVLSLVMVACGGQNEPNQEVVQDNAGQSEIENSGDSSDGSDVDDKQTVYPLTVTDASGKEVTFEEEPKRIVSLAPSETEVLFALGLNDRVVGVNEWSNFPEEAMSKPKIGSFDGNAETIIAAEPDLVLSILSLNNPTYIENYRNLGLTVYTVEPQTIEETMQHILQIGIITNTQVEAEKVVAQMEEELNKVVQAVSELDDADKKKVYIEISEGWTVGKGVFMDELISLSGGYNIIDDAEGWVEISEEKIIQSNPDVIFYSSYEPNLVDVIKGRSGWQGISALESDQFAVVNDDMISRPGPRITQGLIEVANAIHPNLVP